MTQLPPDDHQWQEFLRQHCSPPPPAAADSEEQLMRTLARQEQTIKHRQIWAASPAIVAGILMAWSSYRHLITSPDLRLEAFLTNNWNGVVGEQKTQNNSPEADWMVLANTGH